MFYMGYLKRLSWRKLIQAARMLALTLTLCCKISLDFQRFPVVWQGTLAMKQSETTVQMHLVYGSMEMLTRCLGDANADAKNAVPIRVNQRMRLEHAQVQGWFASGVN